MNNDTSLNTVENTQATASAALSDNGDADSRTASTLEKTAAPELSDPDTRRAEFERLISGEYNDLFTERVSGIINRRFAENKRTEASRLKQRQERIDSQIRTASDGFTQRAMQAANEAEELYSDWLAQAQALKGEYPSLAVEDALKNPSFGKLLLEGFSVKDAYEACNLDSVRESIRAEAARDAEARTLDRIRLHGLRPGENGANGSSGVISTSMASLTRAERAELAMKAMRGLL